MTRIASLAFATGPAIGAAAWARSVSQTLGPLRVPMGLSVPGIDDRQMALNLMHWLSGLIGSRCD